MQSGPVGSLDSYFAQYADWYDDYAENVVTFTALSDLNQPYSCSAWANLAPDGSGMILHDTGYGMFNLYNSQSGFPSTVFIDHTMTVYQKYNTVGTYVINYRIQEMLDSCIDAGLCGAVDFDNDGLIDDDNCPNDYNPGQEDSDDDMIGDACDDCHNMNGDVNDDIVIDILDIVSVVNMVLSGGANSSDFTECEKLDADMDSNSIINILDVIQIINIVLGNRQVASLDVYVDVTYNIVGNDLELSLVSEVPLTGIELAFFSDFLTDVTILDNNGREDIYKATALNNDIQRYIAVSLENQSFNSNSLRLVIEDGATLDIEHINIVAGNQSSEVSVRWNAAEIHNFEIANVYPNPFNPVTQIDYNLNQDGNLKISVYNILGQEVAVLYSGYQTEGNNFVTWDATSMSSGVYYITMALNGQVDTHKAVLVK